MPQDLPVVCSLNTGALEQRLSAIGEIGVKSLVESQEEGGKHVLRFRADSGTRERLEEIIDAERRCCAFLDLSLKEDCCHLILSVAAPEAGRETADGFAMAFTATSAS